jgi:hypothetical protein
MATLLELCEQGVLDTIDPLEADEVPWRTLYGTAEFLAWLEHGLPSLNHNELYSDLSPEEQVFAAFAEYVSGEELLDDRRFKKLSCRPEHYVWELKTDEVRIFGWVPHRDAFICCFGDSKDRIVTFDSYGTYIARTVNVRNKLNLDEPKLLASGALKDVVSPKD